MGIPFDKLDPPKWGGPVPERPERGALALGPHCVIDPPVVLSPMAAVTNPPYRMICREMGAGLVVTEMINARRLAEGCERTWSMLDIRPSEHPVCVQLFGNDPGALAEAAAIVEEEGADAVDLNMGCPMRKVVSSGKGAALLQTPNLVYDIFAAMVDAVDIPVTGKTRAGWEDTSALEVALRMQEAGASAITIHGRTRCEMYDGHVDLAIIGELVEETELIVIGNGDVRDWQSARRMFHTTGCDAVMVARGALGNPWVFRDLAADLRGEEPPGPPTLAEKQVLLEHHVDLYVETFGEGLTAREIRKHLLWYFRGTPGEQTLRRRLSDLESREHISAAIQAAVDACEAQVEAA
jgi:nifR3 family TIM-barrel protein